MKKLILIPALLFMMMISQAQQDSVLKSKKGKIILPEKHDFCVGISGNTFFDYLGNFFNQAGNNNLYLGLVGGNTLYGKFFLNNKNALRLRFNLNINQSQYVNKVPNDLDPQGTSIVLDKLTVNTNYYTIAFGYEKRHGKGRLQIIGGAELLLNRNYTTSKYQYGNPFSTSNTAPNTTNNFTGFNGSGLNYSRTTSRPLNSNNDSGFGYGLRAYFGLEYFIFPKISVATEFGFSGNIYDKGIISTSTEYWNFSTRQTSERYSGIKANRFSSVTDNMSGQISLLFYFN